MPHTLQKAFQAQYPWAVKSEIHTAYAPYRVCPLGAHIDHQYGIVTGFTLDKGVTLRFLIAPDGAVNLDSMNFSGHVQFDLENIGAKEGNWGDYVRGAAYSLSKKCKLKNGFKGIVRGTIPIGGLSSSAAVILCYINALAYANNIVLTQAEMISFALAAENEYVGINVGKLDQSCEVLCKAGQLLYLDTSDDSYQLIPASSSLPPFELAVFFSGVARSLGSGYNTRVDEAKSAAYALKAYEGTDCGLYKDTRLRDVPVAVYEKWKDRLPEIFAKRALHYYSESQRVQNGLIAWKEGDLVQFGKLVFESGYSSIHNWETGSPELITIYDIMCETEGIYGGRFSGAGFKGCCVAIIDPAYRESIAEYVTKRYLEKFPQYADSFSIHFCKTNDGVSCS